MSPFNLKQIAAARAPPAGPFPALSGPGARAGLPAPAAPRSRTGPDRSGGVLLRQLPYISHSEDVDISPVISTGGS